MKKLNMHGITFPGVLGLMIILAALLFIDCNSGGGGGDDDGDGSSGGNSETYVISLGGLADDIELAAGQTTSHRFIGTTPGPKRTYNDITLNLQQILDAGYLETTSIRQAKTDEPAAKATSPRQPNPIYQWEVSLRFSDSADLSTVCEEGWLYGPYTVSGTNKPETAETASVSAEPATVDLVNYGSFAMCIEISSPIDLTLSIKDYSVDVATCDEDPADFAGTWTGTYSCYNEGEENCDDEINQPITLTITQEGHSAKYTDDGDAFYEGTVCGNVFAFNGGVEGEYGYVEKGKFTLNSDGTLGKESSFVSADGSCTGSCEDLLERAEM
jgi:hypothetical protein